MMAALILDRRFAGRALEPRNKKSQKRAQVGDLVNWDFCAEEQEQDGRSY